MNQRASIIASVAIVVAIIVGAIVYLHRSGTTAQLQNASQAPVASLLSVGVTAPEFAAASTQGPFDLKTAKKPVLLEVFATWCPHCQRETVVMNELYAAFKDQVEFIAVSGSATAMDGISPSGPEDVVTFAKAFDVRYPIAYDGDLAVANAYLQGGYPTIVIIDRNKKIAYLKSGEITEPVLAAQLQKVI